MRPATFLINDLNPSILRSGFFSVAARNYHSQRSFFLSEGFRKEIAIKLDPITQEFSGHRAIKHQLFTYLKEQSQEGFTSKQFLIYRDNFFHRTQLVIPSMALTVRAAMIYGDYDGATLAFRNLKHKMGDGEIHNMHSQLLLQNHNIHGIRVFGVDPLARVTDAEKSELLLPEVEKYRKAKEEIFTRPYPYVAGNTWAHELAADSMLDNFREAFFTPYLGKYKTEELEHVMKFFAAHKDESREGGDVEQEHERMAREAVESACLESLANIEQVREGGLIFLRHQAELWDGMLRELENARYVGHVVTPKPMESAVADNHENKQNDAVQKSPNPTIKLATLEKTKALGKGEKTSNVGLE